jgi:hypothetical protein
MCRLVPSAVLRQPFCAFCRFVRLLFCVSAVISYAVLCVCRFVRLPFRDLPFCMCIFLNQVANFRSSKKIVLPKMGIK